MSKLNTILATILLSVIASCTIAIPSASGQSPTLDSWEVERTARAARIVELETRLRALDIEAKMIHERGLRKLQEEATLNENWRQEELLRYQAATIQRNRALQDCLDHNSIEACVARFQ